MASTTERHGLRRFPRSVKSHDQDFNTDLDVIEALMQTSVLDITNTPPSSPSAGDLYICGTSPTGAWSGHAKDIAQYLDSGWTFYDAKEGYRAWVEDDDVLMVFNGTIWEQLSDAADPGVINLADLATKTLLDLTDAPDNYTSAASKLVAVNSGATAVEFIAAPEELQGNYEGVPANSAVVFRRIAGRAMSIPDDFSGSQAKAGVAATAEAVFTIEKNGSGVGTLTWAAEGTTGTWATTAGALSLAAGDILTITGPANNDDTLADLAIAIIGTRA